MDDLQKGIKRLEILEEILLRKGYARVKYWCVPEYNDGQAERIEYIGKEDFMYRGTSYMRFYGNIMVSIDGLQSVREISKEEYQRKRRQPDGQQLSFNLSAN